MTDQIKTILDPKRMWIPLATVVALCGGLYWIGYSVANIDAKISSLGDRIASLEVVVRDGKDATKELMSHIMDQERRINTLENTCLRK